jgi:AraC-like DNA-binding protein
MYTNIKLIYSNILGDFSMTEIKYVGCGYVEPANFTLDIPDGRQYLLLLTHTPGLFWVNGELKEYPAGCAVLYHPHQKVYYSACGENFTNDWIRFVTNEPYITSTNLPRGVPFIVKDFDYCSKLIELLFNEMYLNSDDNSYRELSIEYLLMILLNKLMESYCYSNPSPRQNELFELRKMINSNPNNNWTVKKKADQLYISPGYLQTIYKKTFGISCMDDVINARIRMAKEFLLQANYTLTEIAELCGYSNVEHFCRQFKEKTGCTPGEFRNGE